MKPIISPWLIYFASKADGCLKFFIIFAILFAVIALSASADYEKSDNESLKDIASTIKIATIGCIVFAIMAIVTPSTKTIYTMMAVNEITPDNIQTIGKTGKDIVDYITDQIDKIVNEDDEKENK